MARPNAYDATLVEVRRERMTGRESKWLVSFTRKGNTKTETARTVYPVAAQPRDITVVTPGARVDVILNGRGQVVSVQRHQSLA